MFERLTDRSRLVLQLALREAQALGCEYLGSEHILLGMLAERHGIAHHVLHELGITLETARAEVQKASPPPVDTHVTLGKLPMTPRAKAVISAAVGETRKLGHSYVGTEHLLLGLAATGEGLAHQVLVHLGATPEKVRQEVLDMLGRTPPPTTPTTPITCERLRLLVEEAGKQWAIVAAGDAVGAGNVEWVCWGKSPEAKVYASDVMEAVATELCGPVKEVVFESFKLDAARNKAEVERLQAVNAALLGACEEALQSLGAIRNGETAFLLREAIAKAKGE